MESLQPYMPCNVLLTRQVSCSVKLGDHLATWPARSKILRHHRKDPHTLHLRVQASQLTSIMLYLKLRTPL